ncbi:MAG TPA: HYR domain-containing protein, partial [Saprospiraceae bacterium]|nr:HYR domain-containing protein [Saprospiraceae bacterium]
MESYYTSSSGRALHTRFCFKRLLLLTLLVSSGIGLKAQVLIDPAGDGGFNNGSTFAANNWLTYYSAFAYNKWSCGGSGQPSSFGSRSAFISNDDGNTWSYNSGVVANVAHLYRLVTFPAGVNGFTLEFDWASVGETSYDYLLVSLAQEGNIGLDPVETLYSNINDPGSGNDKLKPPAFHLARLGASPTKQHITINIPQWMIGNCNGEVVKKVVFTWVNDTSIEGLPPAIVDNISLIGYDTPVSPLSISHPADVCITGTNPEWQASPEPYLVSGTKGEFKVLSGSPSNAIVNLGGGKARLNLNKATAGRTIVQYIYETQTGCVYTVNDTIRIYDTPVSNLKNTFLNCLDEGDALDLRAMFQGKTSEGGTFTVTESGNPGNVFPVDSIFMTVPPGGGCFTVKYTVPDPNNCAGGPVSDTKSLLLTTKPKPKLVFNQPKYICQDGGVVLVTVDRTSTGDNPLFTKDGVSETLGGTFLLSAPSTRGAFSYEFCLKEKNGPPGNCSGMPGLSSFLCSDSICERIVVYNDGNGCAINSPFLSECFPDFDLTDPCTIYTRPNMEVSCGVIVIPGFNVLEARLTEETNLVFCDEDSLEVGYQGSLPGVLGDVISGGQTFRELGGAATEIVCDIITFTIPLGPLGSIDPLPLGPYEELCDQTLSQFVFSYLGDLIGGDDGGGGGFVVADTDGDGAFDIVLKDYVFPAKGIVRVPNNVKTAKGTITIRNVTGWPNKPASACGVVTADGINLLDILPIGTFPVLGSMIEDILDAFSCDIPLDFTDQETVEIPVINTTPPEFANCNPQGYVFSEDLSCSAPANWSVPVAYDGCNGELLAYKGYLNTVETGFFGGVLTGPVTVTESGVYQTGGPLPGSDLPAGTYSVTYTAYSCGGVTATCTFPVVVSAGDPVLACPVNMTVKTDVDACTAVVTGLTPRQGLGCASIINYGIDYPAVPGFSDVFQSVIFIPSNYGTHLDASGRTFPLGVSTVSYNMLVDINGNGFIDGGNEDQDCSFTVTVVDGQKPEAKCQDVEVQLNNQGSATVFAVNQNNGSIFVNGGSFDNCDATPTIQIAFPGGTFGSSLAFDCDNIGNNLVNLRVTDDFNNVSNCIANVVVKEFFENIQMELDLPQLCLEANNPVQFDFANYLSIYLPNGQHIKHSQVASNTYLGDVQGFFGISAFLPHPGSPSNNPGTISSDGIYTPGTGTGFVTVSYILALPGVQQPGGNTALGRCYAIVHATFELRQPLQMTSPECACVQENNRIVDLGVVTGGLEPYTIHYTDGVLDVNGDGTADDFDGQYTYGETNGFNIQDFTQDLGELRIVYTPFSNWSVKIVDARGCEIFRSGSCNNADTPVGPSITCPLSNNTLTTEELVCESQYSWAHPVPSDNCGITLFEYRILNPDGTLHGPINLNASLYQGPSGSNPSGFFQGSYDFELGISVITYYVEDAVGNSKTCSFQVTVSDNDAPRFLNCPAPPVVQNAESMHCDAYVDFALPLAADNCTAVTITKIDQTGLNTGSRFPVGTTIMYWEARDLFNNKDTCQIKVIVNDYWQDPILSCPADVVKNNDPWLCGATVNNIAPSVDGPCENNYGVTYTIYADAALTQVKDCGVTNASGEFFDVGDSWVKYTVQNQPLLLITEVSQSGVVDRLEISNLGPADIDISCLEIKRLSSTVAANQTIGPVTMLPSLAGTILPVGGTRVYDFAFNGPANLPACYTISYMGTIFDEVSTNGYAGCNGFSGTLSGGDVIRKCEDDTHTAADWTLAQPCYPLTLGAINQDLEVMADNGTQTSLQSILPNKVSCTFKVTVKDAENPFCGKLTSNTTYNGAGIPNINAATCNRSTITIPPGNCIIGDIVFNRTGTATPQNSTMTLISPKGIKVVITELPDDSLSTLFAQKAEGTWTLDIVPLPGQTPTITGWLLTINCIAPFDVPNQVLPNQAGQCGAPFTWTHPWFVDNCFNGTIKVAYTSTNAACVPTSGSLLGKGGYINTQFFCVGTTQVTYTLTDAAGNVSTCGFSVTVNDVEKPALTCPPTKYVNLNGGECGAFVNYNPAFAADNCAVVDTAMTPPSGSWFDIGNHLVTIVVTDAAGNTRSCTFAVNVIEYVPTDFNLICNDLSHVSMDATCVFVLNADEALEGDNYHCYDDYIITVKNQANQPVGNIFGAADIGKTFTITVKEPETGNSCWSLLKIEDKLVPALTCPADVTIACSESTSPSVTGQVNIQDCSATSTVIDNDVVDFGECGNPRQVITRTFIVNDAWGNQSLCQQTITVKPFDLADLVMPANITVDCETAYLNPQATAPAVTGQPSINGAPIGVGGNCSASIGFTDVRLDICAGSYEIYRTWQVANTCLPPSANNPVSHVQRIRVKDFGGPAFVCPPAVTVTTDPYTCCATAALPKMIVSEGCSVISGLEAKVTGTNPNNGNIITFTVGGYLTDFPGNNYWNPDTLAVFNYTQCMPLGDYNVQYTAQDQCGNISKCNFVLTVADLVPPTVSCDQVTQVALTADGVAVIPAANLNDGTTDNCCLDFFEVRRMDGGDCTGTDFAPDVQFCCSDIGDTVMVVFRAWDCHGNYNDCMVSVLVEDKIKPACQSPANVSVNCENFDPSLWSYGIPDVLDNCCLDTNKVYLGQIGLTHSVNYALFDTVCNKGTITRTFRAFDCSGNSSQCTQRVFVNYLQDYYVKF